MNEQNTRQHINAILTHLDEQKRRTTRQETATDESHTLFQQRSRTVDVFVIEREEEDDNGDLQIIESSLEEVLHLQPKDQDHEPEIPTTPSERQKVHSHRPLVLLIVLGILSIGIGSSIVALQFFTPSATITLVTQTQQLTITRTVQVITNGLTDPNKNQIPGRVLPTITISQQKTIPTTGVARQDAKAAHGLITFYNAAPYIQMVQVGTMITGSDGIQILTDQDAIIPAAAMPTEGHITIVGHAAIVGPAGNIRAGDVYGQCCRLNVFVENGAFHDGQRARTYQTVTPQDITSVVSSLKTSLIQGVQAALQTQVQPTETLVTPLSCTSTITPNYQPGEETTQVQITMNETCTGVTYTTWAVTTLLGTLAARDAMHQLGAGYTTTGVHITQARITNHSCKELDVTAVSLWTHPFTQDQQDTIKATIAGNSKDKATATLLHMAGVQSVSITLKNSPTVPTDVQRLHLLFLQI